MKSAIVRIVALAVLLLGAGLGRGEKVLLKGGYEITGDVLKQDDKTVVVDIGCAVIRLARSEVTGIVKDQATTGPAVTTAPVERASQK